VLQSHERLLRERLHSGEVIEGILRGPTLTAAVTPERLLTVGPAEPNGWEMKSLPWRLIGIAPSEADDSDSDQKTIHLVYFRPVRVKAPRQVPTEGDAEPAPHEVPEPQPSGEMVFVLPSDGGKMAALLTARVSGATEA
jgi:hypothetical protein